MKIVINNDYGGFQLSDEAWSYLGLDPRDPSTRRQIDTPNFRSNPKLVECVEALGERANGTSWGESCLRIIELPDDVNVWHIVENEGIEYIREGEAIDLAEKQADGKYQLQLNGKILITRRCWQCEDERGYWR